MASRTYERGLGQLLTARAPIKGDGLVLQDGSRVAVVGGGPAGSFFSYFLITLARRLGIELEVDIFEPRDFSLIGPGGCNMCGGIISESLVQMLAAEGLRLPPTVIERGIDSYVMHTEEGSVRIETPLNECRIGAVHRGGGPRGMKEVKWKSFDGFLLEQATGLGARVFRGRVERLEWLGSRPKLIQGKEERAPYDLVAIAVGVNSPLLTHPSIASQGYQPPPTSRTYITEYYLGEEALSQHLGSSMHVFLLNLPRLEFAAIIPKGDFVTLCILGRDIDAALVTALLGSEAVRRCMPHGWEPPADGCHCSPRIAVGGAQRPFADRLVFVGDCGISRLYKDGIGSAYRTAKAAAVTAVFDGISAADFQRNFWRSCQSILSDNRLGRLIFMVTREIQRRRCHRIGLLRMVAHEQSRAQGSRPMSSVLWDVFTGSAPYRDVLLRTMHPRFWAPFLGDIAAGLVTGRLPASAVTQR